MAEEKKKMSRETKKKIRNAVIAGVLLAGLSGGGFVFAKQQQTKAKAAAQESTVNTWTGRNGMPGAGGMGGMPGAGGQGGRGGQGGGSSRSGGSSGGGNRR